MSDRLLGAAREEAERLSHPYIGTEHLLLALLRMREPSLVSALNAAGVSLEHAQSRLEKGRRGRRPPVRPGEDGQPGVTSHARRALEAADGDAPTLVQTFLADQGSLLTRLLKPVRESRESTPPSLSASARSPETTPQERPRRERARGETRERPPEKQSPRERGPAKPKRADARAPAQQRIPHDDEPPFVPRLAVQPRPRRRFPWMVLPLALVPLAFLLERIDAGPLVVLLASGAGLMIAAGFSGTASDHLASRAGPALGELASATLGHSALLIVALVALQAGLDDLAKTAIMGGILGHLLLVPGLAALLGGSVTPASASPGMRSGPGPATLVIALAVLMMPSLIGAFHPNAGAPLPLGMTGAAAVTLILTFAGLLLLSRRTGQRLMSGDSDRTAEETWSRSRAAGTLVLAIAAIVVLAGIMIRAVQELAGASGWSEVFLGLIVIPLVASVAGRGTAVVIGRRGDGHALAAALTASTQIVLLVAPLLVAGGLLLGRQVTFEFAPFQVSVVSLVALVALILKLDRGSRVVDGAALLALYALVAVGAWLI